MGFLGDFMTSKRIVQNIGLIFLGTCIFFYMLPKAGAADKKAGQIKFTFVKKKSGKKKGPTHFSGNRLETKYTFVQYRSPKGFKKFNRKIDYSPAGTSLGKLFSSSKGVDTKSKVKFKIDALYERVQEILDMRKRSKKKLIIDLYDNKRKMGKTYEKLYGGKLVVRAWYVFELNTIFVNANDVNEGMLAHEMAHSIIDHFLTVRPPRASAEILAVYVDTHLFRRTKKYNTFQ